LDGVSCGVSKEYQRRSALFVSWLLIFLTIAAPLAIAQKPSRRFTVSDDIGITHLDAKVTFSPDDRYFFVTSERGRLDLNRAESSIRVYRVRDVADFLAHPGTRSELAPLWTLSKSTYKSGPIISDVRWLADSSGVVFLAKTDSGNDQLFLADIHADTVEALTPENQQITGFDVHNKQQFVYTALSPAIQKEAVKDRQSAAFVGTGRGLDRLIFPEDWARRGFNDLSELWAVLDSKLARVVDTSSDHPVPIHFQGQRTLALSPDGRSVVTALTISDIPAEWETLYPPRFPSYPQRIRGGPQNPDAFMGQRHVSEYVLLDLYSGRAKSIAHAPIGSGAGWWSELSPADWSADGRSVAFPNSFLPPAKRGSPAQANQPCAVVADLVSGGLVCLERFSEATESENQSRSQRIISARFVHGNQDIVVVTYSQHRSIPHSTTFIRQPDGSWKGHPTGRESARENEFVEISITEGINSPPLLVATDKRNGTSRTVWDPNPQLRDIEIGDVSVFKWKDKTGRDWVGGLYKPPDYVPGVQYPLVIQTHGFSEQSFLPSGSYPTTFAAQELAAVGFLVLQVEDCPATVRTEEGSCQVAGYESAVEQLSKTGQVNPDQIGIIGFSRSCYYVLQTLTTSNLHFKAASIADGVNHGYLQYILDIDGEDTNGLAHDAEASIGVSPFGTGLNQWLARSPAFNLDKVTAPVEVVASNGFDVLFMWEPYAALRYLRKPVDLVIFNSDEHVFTNPAERILSQGNTVDWFRFWLKGEEDPDPAKTEQYARWHELRKVQERSQAGGRNSTPDN
jgi:dienelactone hydrolase